MSEMTKKYYLDQQEIAVLFAGCGINKLYGVFDDNHSMNNKEICETMHRLYVNQLVFAADDGSFKVEGYLKTLIDEIAKSSAILVAMNDQEFDRDIVSMYLADKNIVVANDNKNPTKVLLYEADKNSDLFDAFEVLFANNNKIILSVNDIKTGREIRKQEISTNNAFEKNKKLFENFIDGGKRV